MSQPTENSDLSMAQRLLEVGIAAGRATSERDFRAQCDVFHLLWDSCLGHPESTGGTTAATRSLASALNANHD